MLKLYPCSKTIQIFAALSDPTQHVSESLIGKDCESVIVGELTRCNNVGQRADDDSTVTGSGLGQFLHECDGVRDASVSRILHSRIRFGRFHNG